jgi:MFS family permease
MSFLSQQPSSPHLRRNFALGITNGAFFGFVDAIVSPYLVLPLFVAGLGGSPILVGLLPAIYNGGWFLPQFLISHRLQGMPRKLGVYTTAGIVRIACWIAFTAATFLIANSNPTLLLFTFFILFVAYSLGAGFAGAPFMDIVAKTISSNRRGTFFGNRDLVGAIFGIAGGYLVNVLLHPSNAEPFPLNFGVIFAIAGIAIIVGVLSFSFVIEPPEKASIREVTFHEQVGSARHLLRENNVYRRFLLTRIVIAVSDIASPFYAIYATSILKVPAETIGTYIAISTASSLIANPIWARISDRRGNRVLFIGASFALVVSALIALVFGFLPSGPALALPFGLIFVFAGVSRTAVNICAPSYLLEIAPASERPLYLGVTNSILGVATFLPVAGGVLVDLAGISSVIFLALVFSGISAWLAASMTEPPRK